MRIKEKKFFKKYEKKELTWTHDKYVAQTEDNH